MKTAVAGYGKMLEKAFAERRVGRVFVSEMSKRDLGLFEQFSLFVKMVKVVQTAPAWDRFGDMIMFCWPGFPMSERGSMVPEYKLEFKTGEDNDLTLNGDILTCTFGTIPKKEFV